MEFVKLSALKGGVKGYSPFNGNLDERALNDLVTVPSPKKNTTFKNSCDKETE
jgi:hypothetical protein